MRVLIADDDPISRLALETKLTECGYEVVGCGNGTEALRVMEGPDAPQLAILDWIMPDLDGLSVCREIRKRGREAYVYVLMLTVRDRKQDLIVALEAGADDYLTKPFDLNELKARLWTGRRILALQQELIASRDDLRIQASHDPLTSLWNRGAILSLLKQEMDRASRESAPMGVALGDLDLFKQINDRYGHLVGDAVLRQVTAALQQNMRLYDAVGRYGGEEFLIVIPGCDLEQARQTAERLRLCVEALPLTIEPEPGRSETIHVTMSFGVAAMTPPSRLADPDGFIRDADTALYRAKEGKGNRVELFEKA